MKTAWVFPGQGSQKLGMGVDLASLPAARATFDLAQEVLGWSVLEVCAGDEDKLNNTRYTQPCLYTIECILVDLLSEKGMKPEIVAGHSLGEYVALYAAGAFDFKTGLELVKRRAELMEVAAGGKMAALIGGNRDDLNGAIAATEGVVLANDNSEAQMVVSGTPEGVEALLEKIKVKRAIVLNVSGAFHSPYMATAAAEFDRVLAPIEFKDTTCPVISNVEPTGSRSGSELKHRLSQQMTGSVRWREICQTLSALGIEKSIEIGPGKVLTGLIGRTCSGMETANIGTAADI
jgi:[acyl-carrier-protein] S-malonyltransferase